LNLAREIAANGKELLGATRALKSPVLNMTGDHSPHVDATVAFNGRLQPNRCTWMKIQVQICRHWKDHFKSDLRSDQDHRLKKDLRSDQDQII
jgi:dienelactone hydrolase